MSLLKQFGQQKTSTPKTKQKRERHDDLVMPEELPGFSVSTGNAIQSKTNSLTSTNQFGSNNSIPRFNSGGGSSDTPSPFNTPDNPSSNNSDLSRALLFSKKSDLRHSSSGTHQQSQYDSQGTSNSDPSPEIKTEEKSLLINDFDPNPVLSQITTPIRQRLKVQIPLDDYNIVRIQTDLSINAMEKEVYDVEQLTSKTAQDIGILDTKVRTISAMSMDLTQTAEAVDHKVAVFDDWLDGLESAGSGLKMQFIDWGVKVISFLSSLLLLFFNTVKMANPRNWHRKSSKAESKEEESSPDPEQSESGARIEDVQSDALSDVISDEPMPPDIQMTTQNK